MRTLPDILAFTAFPVARHLKLLRERLNGDVAPEGSRHDAWWARCRSVEAATSPSGRNRSAPPERYAGSSGLISGS